MQSNVFQSLQKIGSILSFLLVLALAAKDEKPVIKDAVLPKFDCDFQGQFPYIVAIMDGTPNQNYLCGGILIAPDVVLTAAQCIDRQVRAVTTTPLVHVGGIQLDEPIAIRETIASFVHPEWTGNVYDGNDIAILRLNESTCIDRIINLANDNPKNRDRFVLSYGATSARGPISNDLNGGYIHILNNTYCNDRFFVKPPLKKGQLCSRSSSLTAAWLCHGDEGSPAVHIPSIYEFNDAIVGISSYSTTDCGDTEGVSVLTDVREYLPWIKDTMKTFN